MTTGPPASAGDDGLDRLGQVHRTPAPRTWAARATGGLSAAAGAIAGITPHVLHHVGPLAGAAILTGAEGSVLFGVLGFLLTLPMLFRLRRRFGSWLAPGIAAALFLTMYLLSTFVLGPIIRGEAVFAPTPPSAGQHHPDGDTSSH